MMRSTKEQSNRTIRPSLYYFLLPTRKKKDIARNRLLLLEFNRSARGLHRIQAQTETDRSLSIAVKALQEYEVLTMS